MKYLQDGVVMTEAIMLIALEFEVRVEQERHACMHALTDHVIMAS